MSFEQPPGPSLHDWAHAPLQLVEITGPEGSESIFELRKEMVVNGVRHLQFVVLTRLQLREIGINHAL
ncbi:MAG: hypothetical protein JNL58_05585 [Planctomyces sp.]|nr:hypothetical protein [Planctomyces sp.]